MSEAPLLLRAAAPAAGKVTLWIAGAALVVFALLPQSTRYVQARDGRNRPMRWLQTKIIVQVAAPSPGVGLTEEDALQAAHQAALGWAAQGVPSIVVTQASVARSAWEDGVSTGNESEGAETAARAPTAMISHIGRCACGAAAAAPCSS